MNITEELARLAQMHQQGLLSDAEFAAAKSRVLDSQPASWGPPVGSQLRRSVSDRWLGGVCGGLARGTGLEAWVWRLAFVIFALFGGSGALAYALLWLFMPREQAAGAGPWTGR